MVEIERRKKRWEDFWVEDGAGKRMLVITCQEGAPNWVRPHPGLRDARMEFAWRMYNHQMEHLETWRDDNVPCLHLFSGTEIWAEALGCAVHRPDDTMPMAVPFVRSAREAAAVKVPRLEDSTLWMFFEMADALRARAGKDALLRIPDMQSPMDVVAQIWDKTDLFAAMIEEPGAVKELARKAQALIAGFYDLFFARYGKAFVAHHPGYYMPSGITFSVDEVGSVSREMFDEYFLGELDWFSERYGGMGIHCCATAEHQWDNFAKVKGLRLMNFGQQPDYIRRAYRHFAGTCALWNNEHNKPPPAVLEDMPPGIPKNCRYVTNLIVASIDDAKRQSEAFFN
ncbi:MAG: hypothetical protein FWF96_02760 [Kiritimatiellaeota bacterium]|nr:hypothetical protein [Kiritimatiellota bacterium]